MINYFFAKSIENHLEALEKQVTYWKQLIFWLSERRFLVLKFQFSV